jgi:2-haloacid dehalogenase
MATEGIKALVFDVFGTVVDWRNSVIREGEAFGRAHGINEDWAAFAEEWRTEGYSGAIRKFHRGEQPWMRVDMLHRVKLDAMLAARGITHVPESAIAEFNRVWHRLVPWPDSVPGLTRLKTKYIVSPLSNGDFSLLTNMAKHSGLPWDCIITPELIKSYKPDPESYKLAARLLDLRLDQVALCAAHQNDLAAAKATGLRTCYITRLHEWGPAGTKEGPTQDGWDVVASNFEDLADKLGA